jgi:hypothetical protein
VKILSETSDSDVGEIPVIPLPAELLGDEAFRFQRLERFDDVEIGDVEGMVFRRVEILFSTDDSLVEEIGVNRLAILFRN